MPSLIEQQYDTLFKEKPAAATAAYASLQNKMREADCRFGDDLIPTFHKPVFLSRKKAEDLSNVLLHIHTILEKVARLYFTHPQLRHFFNLDQTARDLVEIDPGYQGHIIIARPDAFFTDGKVKFVEFNCDSPAGAGYTDAIESLLTKQFPFDQISREFTFKDPERMEILLQALLETYAEFQETAGGEPVPRIAIVDWKEVRTQNEFQIIRKYFMSRGYETMVADPRDLVYRNSRLFAGDIPVDLIYRRVIFRELAEKPDEVRDFIRAYQEKKVCVVNPLRSRLASNKAVLGIITNAKLFRHLFTDDEYRCICSHIPWTRRVKDMQTHYEDNPVFLVDHILRHQHHLVLKPADSYGGKDVVIGAECPGRDWEMLVDRILSQNENWVVQRFVNIPRMDVPVIEDSGLAWQAKKYNINPYVFNGRYAGSVARLSDQSVINVSAGGGLVPVIEYSTAEKEESLDD